MKQMAISKVLTVLMCVLMLCVSVPMLAISDQAQYIYDDLGRLSQVIDGQRNVATYSYDAVGNLLSITRNTGGVGCRLHRRYGLDSAMIVTITLPDPDVRPFA